MARPRRDRRRLRPLVRRRGVPHGVRRLHPRQRSLRSAHNGKTVGNVVGAMQFVRCRADAARATTAYITYRLPENLQEGEFSVMVPAPTRNPGDKSKIFCMQEGDDATSPTTTTGSPPRSAGATTAPRARDVPHHPGRRRAARRRPAPGQLRAAPLVLLAVHLATPGARASRFAEDSRTAEPLRPARSGRAATRTGPCRIYSTSARPWPRRPDRREHPGHDLQERLGIVAPAADLPAISPDGLEQAEGKGHKPFAFCLLRLPSSALRVTMGGQSRWPRTPSGCTTSRKPPPVSPATSSIPSSARSSTRSARPS